MARRRLLLVLLAAFAATAQGAIRWYTNDYEGGLEAAKKSGKPMVIVFGPESDRLRSGKKALEKTDLAPFHPHFIFIYLEVTLKDNSFSHGLFHKYSPGPGQHRFPLIFFADAEEKMLGKTEGGQDIASEMAAVLRKLGGPTSAKKAREAAGDFERANALLVKKQYGAAAKLFKEVIDSGVKTAAAETAKKELAKIEGMAKAQLEAARADIADKAYPAAAGKLLDLVEVFSPLPEAKEAQEELAKLRAIPEARQAIEAAEKKTPPPPRVAPARKLTTDPEDVENDFFTEEELDALDKLASGETPKPAAKPGGPAAECQRLLSLARSWIANKQPAKAREILEAIIEKHPDTIFADQAKALLKKLD